MITSFNDFISELEDTLEYLCDDARHLICLPYTIENLHKMAEDLNIHKARYHAGRHPHYDIPKKRIAEITAKCRVISGKELLTIINTKI